METTGRQRTLTLLGQAELLQQHAQPIVSQPVGGVRSRLRYLGDLTGVQPQEQTPCLVQAGHVPLQTLHHHRLTSGETPTLTGSPTDAPQVQQFYCVTAEPLPQQSYCVTAEPLIQ